MRSSFQKAVEASPLSSADSNLNEAKNLFSINRASCILESINEGFTAAFLSNAADAKH